jgi:hypothetical protein
MFCQDFWLFSMKFEQIMPIYIMVIPDQFVSTSAARLIIKGRVVCRLPVIHALKGPLGINRNESSTIRLPILCFIQWHSTAVIRIALNDPTQKKKHDNLSVMQKWLLHVCHFCFPFDLISDDHSKVLWPRLTGIVT